MKMRWWAAGITAVLVIGGLATVAQRVISQKTRGVLLLSVNSDSKGPSAKRIAKPTEPANLADDVSRPPMLVVGSSNPEAIPPPGLPEPKLDPTVVEPAGLIVAEPVEQPITPTVAITEASPPKTPSEEADPVANPVSTSLVAALDPAASEPALDTTTKAPGEVPSKIDPVDSVETFLERNRKEADSAIQTLSVEAENLKNRLAKVETALGRWQSFARALNADQPASQPNVAPSAKLKWNRPGPENPAQSTNLETDAPLKVSAESAAKDRPTEPPTPAPVPSTDVTPTLPLPESKADEPPPSVPPPAPNGNPQTR